MNKVNTKDAKKRGKFQKFLDWVEKAGNKMPHPVSIFLILCIAIIIISFICAKAGVSVT